MENDSSTPLKQEINSNERPAPSIVPDGQFRFEPIEGMFDSPEENYNDYLMSSSLAADDISNVNEYKSQIDRFGINAMANLAVPYPSFAGDTYDPRTQDLPDLNENTFSRAKSLLTLEDTPVSEGRVAPAFSGMRQSQFLRYYEHPEFDDLGFSPYSSMENFYNVNSTLTDDMMRMGGQWTSLVGTGLNSVYGSMFSGKDYLEPDVDAAQQFEDAMGISSSTRGGAGAFMNNLAANSAYTFGILASIAIEEVILAGAAALQGGFNPVSDAALIAGTARNTVRGTKAFFSFTKLFENTRKILQKTKEIETARDFFNAAKTGSKIAGTKLLRGFTPNSVKAFQNIKTAQNAGQNMSNLAKMSKGFGGFYRDMRAVNLAMAESKLESGFVYNKVVKDGMNEYSNANGGKSVGEYDMSRIANAANQAAFKTMIANAPIIYASNWFVIGNAMGGFQRGLQRTLGSTFQRGINKNIVNTAGRKVINGAGKAIKSPFKYIANSTKNTFAKIKAGGIAGLAGSGGIAMLRYFSANVAEGIQEVSQEAISAATTGYYTEILSNPAQGGIALKDQMIMSAMGNQFSGQGAEVFLSGFLMGGLVSVPQKLFMQGVPSVYRYGLQEAGIGLATKKQKQVYSEFKAERKKMVDQVVKSYNESWDSQAVDPTSLFDLNKLNFMIQKEMAEGIKSDAFLKDRFGITDKKDSAKFQQYFTMFAGGGSQFFKDQLKGYLDLSDEELSVAFEGAASTEKKSGKLRSRINDMLISIDKMEATYNREKDNNVNPFDHTKFNRKTQEVEWINELLKEQAFEHVRYLKMFTEDGFNRALERADTLYAKLESDPLFKKMEAKDLTVLLSPESIDEEIKMLLSEVIATEGSDKDQSKINKARGEKIKLLMEFKKISTDPANRFKNGSLKRNKLLKGNLRGAFQNYVKFMAKEAGTFVNQELMDDALTSIVDYSALQGRARLYDRSIEYLANPERFGEIVDRQTEVNRQIYNNRTKIIELAVKQHTDIVLANELIVQLGKQGIYPDVEQAKAFLQSGNVSLLKDFIDDNGVINPEIHTVKAGIIDRLITTYGETQSESTKEEKTTTEETKKEDVEEARTSLDIILDQAGIDVKIDTATNSPMLKLAFRQKFKEYTSLQASVGLPALSAEDWLNSAEGVEIRNTFNAIKKVWASGQMTVNEKGQTEFNNSLEQSIIDQDTGFEEFLTQPNLLSENPLITTILNQTNIKLADLVQIKAAPKATTQGVFTPTENFTDAEGNPIPAGPELTTKQNNELGPLTEEEVIAVSTPRKIFKDRLDRINEFLQGKRKASATVDGNGSYTAVIYTDKFNEVDGLGRDMRDGVQVLLTQEEANRMLLIKAQKKSKKITLKEAEAAEQEVLRDAYTRALEQYEIVDDAPILDVKGRVEAFNKSKATPQTNAEQVAETQPKLTDPVKKESYETVDDNRDSKPLPYEGVLYDLHRKEIPGENGKEVNYRILDKNGNPLPEQLKTWVDENFKSFGATFLQKQMQTAIAAARALDETAPDTTEFEFDGVQGLFYGMPVYRGNVKYIIIQKPGQVKKFGKNQKLRVIKESDNLGPYADRKFELIKQGEFNGYFSVEEMTFTAIPDNVTKLSPSDLTAPYPYVNRRKAAAGISKEQFQQQQIRENAEAKDRYNLILSILTPTQIENLEFYVSLDSQGGGNLQDYAIQNAAGVTYKEANPLINRVTSKYKIGIRLSTQAERDQLAEDLVSAGMEVPMNNEGIFAFVNNSSFIIKDQTTRQEIDPRTITKGQAKNTIYADLNKDGAIEEVQNAFILNALMVQTFDNMNIGLEPKSFKSSELPFTIKLNPIGGNVAYSKGKQRAYPKPMSALMYKGADESGNLFVFDLKFDKETGERIINYQTNLKGDARKDLYNRIKEQLEKQQEWSNLKQTKDRYLAMILLPNGRYAKVNIKARSYTQEQLDALYVKLVTQAQEVLKLKTQEERIEKATEVNKEIADDLYLSSKPGNMIDLNIGPDGTIYFKISREFYSDVSVGIDVDNYTGKELLSPKKIIEDLIHKYNTNEDVASMDGRLSPVQFRESFADGADPTTVYDKSTTSVRPEVVTNQQINLSSSADLIQASRDIAYISPLKKDGQKVIDEAELVISNPIAGETDTSIINMTDEDFESQLDNDFAGYQPGIEQLINKILRGEELLPLEVKMMKNPVISSSVNLQVESKGGPGSLSNKEPAQTKETKLQIAQERLEELEIEITDGLTLREGYIALDENAQYQAQLEKIKKLARGANKLVSATTEPQRIQDYNEFLIWAQDNLPDIIDIQDLSTLATNGIADTYDRVGAFVLNLNKVAGGLTVNGTIYTGVNSPYKYHEAFHSIFRTVLTQEEINRYRSIAKSELKIKYAGKYNTELQKFKNSAEQYQSMTQEELENEFAEEYIADEFDLFKSNPRSTKTNSEIKSFFTKLIEWIKGVFSKYSPNELLTLFENIDAGKYRNAEVKSTEFYFYNAGLSGSLTIANALVKYGYASKSVEGQPAGELYIDSEVIDPLIRSMAGMFINRVQSLSLENKSYNPDALYKNLTYDFRALLDPRSITNTELPIGKIEQLEQLDKAFREFPGDIKREVYNLINIISDQDASNQLNIDSEEDSNGLRSTGEFNKDASQIGGFNSLSFKVRAYIATTTLPQIDFFGKTELLEGETLIVPVKFSEAYNGLLKSVSNLSDSATMLQRMYSYSRLNPQMKAVVDKLFLDNNLTEEDLASDAPFKNVKDGQLLQSILKGFENYKVDYIFNERDSSGNLLVYTASERDDINSQLDEWSQAYIAKKKQANADPQRIVDLLEVIKSIKEVRGDSSLTNDEVYSNSRKHSQELFDLTGIRLAPLYFTYSWANSIKSSERTPMMQNLAMGYKRAEAIGLSFLDELYRQFNNKAANIFSKGKTGMASRLALVGLNNAVFDETIGSSTYVNPNGDLVYAHQLPTYHLKL